WCFVQTADDSSRQVDGRCLVSMLSLTSARKPIYRHSRAGGNPDRLFGKWGGGLRACQIKTVFKRVAMRHMQGLEAQSIYYFHRNGRPRPPCKPLKDKPPGLIRAAVGNHLPLDLFEI
ncbi:hypothetical protein ACFEEY_001624, partial [Neisseria gonorrhoeae]